MSFPLIIAEAGVNHNGNPDLAFKLVDVARDAGADVVKFQTFKAESVVSGHAAKADYQIKATNSQESQLDMIRHLELPPETFRDLALYCQKQEIGFMSTPFDPESIDLLVNLGMQVFKIPSGELTNLPHLRRIGKLGRDVILSTGMSTLDEVEAAVEVLEQAGTSRHRMTLLHCTTEYPAPYDEINLNAMKTLAGAFPGVSVGYSDHSKGYEVSIAAAALGASVIEKHFTLDRTMKGPDHAASLEPAELAQMVQAIRHVHAALGDGKKHPTPSEIKNQDIARKSIVAARNIKAGEILTEENLTVKRPGSGISPMLWDSIIGTRAKKDLEKDDLL